MVLLTLTTSTAIPASTVSNISLADLYPYERLTHEGVRGYWRAPEVEFEIAKSLQDYYIVLDQLDSYEVVIGNAEKLLLLERKRRWKWAGISAGAGFVLGVLLAK